MNKQRKLENLLYMVLWTILFIAPVLAQYVRTSSDTSLTFRWTEILTVWRMYIVYFLVFLIHNFFIAPLLIYRHKKSLYLITVFSMLILFQIYQCNSRPQDIGQEQAPFHSEMNEMKGERNGPGKKPDMQMGDEPRMNDNFRPDKDPGMHRDGYRRGMKEHHPPLLLGQHDIVAFVIVFLMLGMNLAIKLYCKSDADEKEMKDLEQKNLEQQLEYLKYQINPHFFMNTLNNIHALVDIDPERAKTTIEELSKMMRYVLYEGAKAYIPIQREVNFIGNYITLMRIRYTDKVRINTCFPKDMPDKCIPPLLFITFIENAFKHGVSYQRESFIDINMQILDEKLSFLCRNSKIPADKDEHGGVGLTNTRKRLDLIYGDSYKFDIKDNDDIYEVRLVIPLK